MTFNTILAANDATMSTFKWHNRYAFAYETFKVFNYVLDGFNFHFNKICLSFNGVNYMRFHDWNRWIVHILLRECDPWLLHTVHHLLKLVITNDHFGVLVHHIFHFKIPYIPCLFKSILKVSKIQ